MSPGMSVSEKKDRIVSWMREMAHAAGASGGILGVSGGIDSALVLALSKEAFGDEVYGLVMPCYSVPQDTQDALYVIEQFSIRHKIIDLSYAYDVLLKSYGAEGVDGSRLAKANLKPRLRMATLYYHANLLNYLVLGTGNKDEIYVGYYTKYGDGGVDILPLADLTKGEVKEMATLMGVPQKIVDRVPSAGLWEGQTDESEMRVSYRELDAYLRGETISEESRERIEVLHKRSEHKRQLPPFPKFR